MLPQILSHELLSLLQGEIKPALTLHMPLSRFGEVVFDEVTFTRDLVRTKVLSPRAANINWEQERGQGLLSSLEEVASNLYRMRSGDKGEEAGLINGFYLETEEGEPLSHPHPVGLFIIQEARFAANAAMGTLLYRHDTPAIYANHVVPMDDEARVAQTPELAFELAQARYAAIPQGHVALGLSARQPYAHITDPLNSYDGLFNVMNLVGGQTERGYLFDGLAARYGARRLNMLHDGEEKARERIVAKRFPQKTLPSAAELLQKLESDDGVHPGDLGTALFSEVTGDDETVASLRQQAAEFLATNIHLSRQVWQMALARGWIEVKSLPLEDGTDTIAINAAGEGFSFNFEGSSKRQSAQTAIVIGQLVNHEIEMVEPAIPRAEADNESNPYKFLESLAAARKIYLSRTTLGRNKETGEATVRVTVSLWDGVYPCEATGPSAKAADKEAARILIERVKLTEEATFIPDMEKLENPVTLLNNHCARRGVGSPIYTFTPRKGKSVTCKVEYVDVSGKPRFTTGKGLNEKLATMAAAKAAIAKLPPPPPKKKKKRAVTPGDTPPDTTTETPSAE